MEMRIVILLKSKVPIMKQKIAFSIFKAFCLLFVSNIIHAQNDSLNKDEIIRYFENKRTSTIYLTPKTLKQNKALQSEIIKTDSSDKRALRNYISKTNQISKTNPGPGGGGGAGIPPKKVITKQLNRPPGKELGIHYDNNEGKTLVYDFKRKVNTGEIKVKEIAFDSASFISLNIENKNTGDFLAKNCSLEIDSGNIYIETGIEICQLELPASALFSYNSMGLEELDADLIEEIEKMDIQNVNNFLFFDSFVRQGQSNSHGESVQNIITNTLEHFHASQLGTKVKGVSLDFFTERNSALKIIDDYLDTKYGNSDINDPIWLKKQYYNFIRQGNCSGLCMPSDYLNILLDYYLMQVPEVISMSFLMKTIFPVMCFSIKPGMYTNLLGAVPNNTGLIENIGTDNTGRAYEPMFTLKSNIPVAGTMLIGAESEIGQFNCVRSSDGSYVSTLGHGYWNNAFTGAPQVYGTSWATPEVATKLFIAKAYWKSSKLEINAIEAKQRLLLSCDLDTNYAGKFASAGIPNINKLLRKDFGGFIEKGDSIYDTKVEGNLISNPKIIIRQKNGDEMLYNFKTGNKTGYFRGLYYKDGNLYLFQDINMKWEKVQDFQNVEFKNFNLKLKKTGKSISVSSLQDLISYHIDQIVGL
jgi:hypothetical protein